MGTSTSTRIANHGPWPGRHAALHRLLLAQQEVLREQRRSLRETPPLETIVGADDEERAAQEFEVGLDIALLEMRSRQVQEIETALHRLEAGSFGRCVDCDQPIVASRLLARPFAVRCRACQEALEVNEGHDPSRSAALAPSNGDGATDGLGRWPGRAPAASKPRRKHRPTAVSVGRPLSYGGVSL
ncbi:MAG TPA: TraR/DksA family transcriptional regulator [Vicinamibacteria bacterium]|nr:TraR/DksA family transcriptional regulator [Vicinamibacteria bacterium]